jgi:hypothetical protein
MPNFLVFTARTGTLDGRAAKAEEASRDAEDEVQNDEVNLTACDKTSKVSACA